MLKVNESHYHLKNMLLSLIIKFIVLLLMLTNILMLIFIYAICKIYRIGYENQEIVKTVVGFVHLTSLKCLKFRFYSHNLL